jgi:hypothetical protein
MGWQDVLNNFKQQFSTLGPEKYADIENPDMRYELASQRSAGIKSGINTAAGMISNNVSESKKAAESKKAQGYTREYNKAGGFTFKGPDGNPVSAFEYSLGVGAPVDKVLEGSYDPTDRQFLEDYTAMQASLDNKEYTMQESMDKLAGDYPEIYLGKGSPTGSKYFRESKAANLPGIKQEWENKDIQKKGFLGSGKEDTASLIVQDFVKKLTPNIGRDEIYYMIDQMRASNKKYGKLTKDDQKLVDQKLAEITDRLTIADVGGIGIGNY